jgi:hypothetical protein
MKYLFEIILFITTLLAVFACVRSWLHRYDIPPKKLAPRRAVPLWMPQRLAAVLCLLFILACAPPGAMAQVAPNTPIVISNVPTWLPSATGINFFSGLSNGAVNATIGGATTNASGTPSNNVISLWQGNGMAFWQKYNMTNAAPQLGVALTNSVETQWAVSPDGTNFLTSPASLINIYSYNGGIGSGTLVVDGSNVTSAWLNNWAYITLYSISNNMTGSTNGVTNLTVSANHGAPFNGGFP